MLRIKKTIVIVINYISSSVQPVKPFQAEEMSLVLKTNDFEIHVKDICFFPKKYYPKFI